MPPPTPTSLSHMHTPTHTKDISLYLHSARDMSDSPNLQSFNRGRSVFPYINILLLHNSLLVGILIQLSITQNYILTHVPCVFILFLLQPTNAQTYITFSLHIMLTPTCFNCMILREFQTLHLANLHKFLNLKLLKL